MQANKRKMHSADNYVVKLLVFPLMLTICIGGCHRWEAKGIFLFCIDAFFDRFSRSFALHPPPLPSLSLALALALSHSSHASRVHSNTTFVVFILRNRLEIANWLFLDCYGYWYRVFVPFSFRTKIVLILNLSFFSTSIVYWRCAPFIWLTFVLAAILPALFHSFWLAKRINLG